MSKLVVDGLNIFYEESGKGENIILIHGWGQSHASWKDLSDRLSNNYHVYNLDLPGFGLSQEPFETWSIKEYTNFIHNFITTLHISNPIIISHSFGGHIAILYASQFPIKKLVLYSGGGLPQNSLKYDLYKYVFINIAKYFIPSLLYKSQTIMFKPKGYQNMVILNKKRSRRMLDIYTKSRPSLIEELQKIKVKTLIIVGNDDFIVYPEMGKKLKQAIQNSQLSEIPDAAHYAHIENPGVFYKELEKFLRD